MKYACFSHTNVQMDTGRKKNISEQLCSTNRLTHATATALTRISTFVEKELYYSITTKNLKFVRTATSKFVKL